MQANESSSALKWVGTNVELQVLFPHCMNLSFIIPLTKSGSFQNRMKPSHLLVVGCKTILHTKNYLPLRHELLHKPSTVVHFELLL